MLNWILIIPYHQLIIPYIFTDELLGKDEVEKGQPPLSGSLDLQSTAEGERQRAHSDLEASKSASLESGGNNHHLRSGEHQRRSPSPSSPFSRYSPGINRKSFGKLGRTLRLVNSPNSHFLFYFYRSIGINK